MPTVANRSRTFVSTLAVLLIAACTAEPTPESGSSRSSSAPALAPAAPTPPVLHFLPPTVPTAGPFTGTFDGNRQPTVKVVCTAATGTPCPLVASFDMSPQRRGDVGIGLGIKVIGESYNLLWLPLKLQNGKDKYRLEVTEDGVRLGERPLWVVKNVRELRDVPAGYIPVLNGLAVLVRFRLETNSAPPPPPPPPPSTPPSCTDCLEIVPGGILLPGLGSQTQLQAFLVDPAGNRTAASPTWTSTNPEHVEVTSAGVAIARSGAGSSQIQAQAGGRTSAAIVATVAAPVVGALLVSDDQIAGGIVPVDPLAKYGPGWRYRVQLRNLTPAAGQIVVGTGQRPVAGRTVSATAGAGGLVDVVLEVVKPSDVFTSLSVRQRLTLGAGVPAAAPSFATTRPMAAVEAEFGLGPFACEAEFEISQSNPLTLTAFSFDVTPNLTADIEVTLTGLKKAILTGTVASQLMVNPVSDQALEGKIECKKLMRIIPLPITGALSVFFGARVAVGVGFGVEAEFPVGGLGVDLLVTGTGSITAGIDCTAACTVVGNVTGTADGFLKPVLPSQSWDEIGRAEASLSGFGWAELRLGGPIEETQASLMEAKVGLKQTADLASEKNQAADASFSAGFELEAFFEAATGETIQDVATAFGIDLSEFTFEAAEPLAESPAGTFTISPARVAAGTARSLGEKATFTVDLSPVTYLGIQSVESVELRWLKDDGTGTGTTSLQNGRVGCSSLPASTGQTHFTCEADFDEADLGVQTFHAFVKAKLFGIPLPILLEVSDDGSATVEVVTPDVTVSPATVSVAAGQTQQFTATVVDATDQEVTWAATGGTISSTGLFTAGTTLGAFTVTATSVAHPDANGTAAVTVTANPIQVAIAPEEPLGTIPGFKIQFSAFVSGTANQAVNWSTTGGSINSRGLWTAPSVGSYSVTARSADDPTASKTVSVSVHNPSPSPPPPGFAITMMGGLPPDVGKFRLRVTNFSGAEVRWTLAATCNLFPGCGIPTPSMTLSQTQADDYRMDWFMTVNALAEWLPRSDISIAATGCVFLDNQPVLNSGGLPICLSQVWNP